MRLFQVLLLSAMALAADIRWVDCASHIPAPLQSTALPSALPLTLACGQIDVPMDYAEQGGANITLGFSMYRPENPQGLLNLYVRGPGQEVSSYPWDYVLNLTQASWFVGLEKFDILAVDTRGYHSSNALNCTIGDWLIPSKLPEQEDEYDDFKAHVVSYAQSCAEQSTPAGILEHLGTYETVRDWDTIRAALGYDTLHHFGISYGTYYGINYAATFPERAGRFALDAVFPTGMSNADLIGAQFDSINRLIDRADSRCLNNTACPFHDQGHGAIQQAVRDVLALASNNTSSSDNAVSASVYDVGHYLTMWYLLGAPQFDDLAVALSLALSGNWTRFDYSTLAPIFTETFAPLARTYCLDYHIEDNSFEGWTALRAALKQSDPYDIKYVFYLALHSICGGWPKTSSSNEKVSVDSSVAFITSDFDYNTPTEGATYEWAQTSNSVLIVRHGDGHGTFDIPYGAPEHHAQLMDGNFPGSARETFINFLASGELPEAYEDADTVVYTQGQMREEIPNAYEVPTGAAYGDTVL
ncbi:hypothetical protein MKEN_01162200 [Mycena kentingensis (nom. inval.)]|nr:hypothetical protein MKEN_01162200 [Mycena kentingensis (nom. inval.)]